MVKLLFDDAHVSWQPVEMIMQSYHKKLEWEYYKKNTIIDVHQRIMEDRRLSLYRVHLERMKKDDCNNL